MKMKFIIKQEILLESLYHTSRAISPRNLIPILTGIKFDLTEEGLFLSASDTDISIRCLIPADKIDPEYFNSAEALCALIEELLDD